MEFNANNPVIRLCIRGMEMETKAQPEEANALFLQAWNEATNAFEKFIAAYFVARQQQDVSDKLKWLQTSLQAALNAGNEQVNGAVATLYTNIAQCYSQLGDVAGAEQYAKLSTSAAGEPTDKGPFYHGTKADLQIGDLLTAGNRSNYRDELTMNHIYFTALVNGAGLAAAFAKGDGPERVYIVEPTGSFEHDPNVTDKKFPGNLTRSYRSEAPLRIVGEVTDWQRTTPAEVEKWREKFADNKGEIIN